MTGEHPLARILRDAADGRFPPADGEVEVCGPPPGPCDVVTSFTAHHVVATSAEAAEIRAHLDPTDLGSAANAVFVAWLGERLGVRPGPVDALLVAAAADPSSAAELSPTDDVLDHPRIARAARYRRDLRVFAVEGGVVAVGRGVADRWEVTLEVDAEHRGRGVGRRLARAAASLVPPDEPLFAQVTPGNVTSTRAFLAAGYRPIGSEVTFLTR